MADEILQNCVLRLVAATNKYLYPGGPYDNAICH